MSDADFLTDEQRDELHQRATDLARAFDLPIEVAKAQLIGALQVEVPLFRAWVRVRWWQRLIPGWRLRLQRRLLAAEENPDA